jgi:hypothetical protein
MTELLMNKNEVEYQQQSIIKNEEMTNLIRVSSIFEK